MDATKYKPVVAWRTWVRNVVMTTQETETEVALYECSVRPINVNEQGALLPLTTELILIDFIGHIYPLSSFDGNTIEVVDIFRTGECPQNLRQGVIVKPVWKGRAIYISPAIFSHLDSTAKDYVDSLNWDILWSNDTNAIRIPFENTDTPAIEDYQEDQVINGITVNLSKDYEENPLVRLVVELVNDEGLPYQSYRTELPCPELDENGKITRIHFGQLEGEYSGFIIISRQ